MKNKKHIQIRQGVFETNSSSTHSIIINYSDTFDDIPNISAIKATGDEFGWENESYNDFYTKLNYIITYLFGSCESEEDYNKIKNKKEYKLLVEVLKTETGIDLYVPSIIEAKENAQYNFDYYGYIDHQSCDVAEEVFKSYQDLSCFLFNSSSILYTGNDNDYDYY